MFFFNTCSKIVVKEGDAMLLNENWAISAERIEDFFRHQDDVTESSGEFFYKSCCITLTPLPPSQAGIFSLSRTAVRMDGPDEEVQEIHHRYFLRFLSAGG